MVAGAYNYRLVSAAVPERVSISKGSGSTPKGGRPLRKANAGQLKAAYKQTPDWKEFVKKHATLVTELKTQETDEQKNNSLNELRSLEHDMAEYRHSFRNKQ
jgi:hypothetical protein